MFTPRHYQVEAEAAAFMALEKHRTTLVELPTGTGKSVVLSSFAAHAPGRVLVLAHRDELIEQLVGHLERATGEVIGVEKAHHKSWHERVVVGSMQTVTQPHRLRRLGNIAFDWCIIDEAHRSQCRSYRRITSFFGQAKVLEVTATPSNITESLAYRMTVSNAIDGGWLVPFKAKRIYLDKLDLKGVRSLHTWGENSGLERAMIESVGGVVSETLRLTDGVNRQGIGFFPGLESAMMATERFNQHRKGSAYFVCGETPKSERKSIVEGYRNGDFQWLVNVGVATEGFDNPNIGIVVGARPTTSVGLYRQMMGRGGRPLAGLLDGLTEHSQASVRKSRIKYSDKPDCLLLDFYGNTGKHSLASPINLLLDPGDVPESVLHAAKEREMTCEEPEDVRDTLTHARTRVRQVAQATRVEVLAAREHDTDPMQASGGKVDMKAASAMRKRKLTDKPASRGQLIYLQCKYGIVFNKPITHRQAGAIIRREEQKRC